MTTDALLLMGPPIVTHHQAVETFMAKRRTGNGYTRADLNAIFRTYADTCTTTGLCFAVAAAQVAHETGWLTSWWSARPRRNPSGIGVVNSGIYDHDPGPRIPSVYDPTMGKWRAGVTFPSWGQAVAAHVGRLLAYAIPAGQGTPDQNNLIAFALAARSLPARYRGCARTLAGLEGTWAVADKPGTPSLYAERLAAKIDMMLAWS